MTANLVPGGPFDVPEEPFKIGRLRSKIWRAPYTHGLTNVWRRRCNEYWERVEERYGVVMSEPRHAWEMVDEVGPVVATYATPLAILKGERIARPRTSETVQ